ncbi:protein CC2D2B-like [Carcharodon carcharias]|uniref:protein CC2D2B-like n=1 Tax=Carcharodon carcharias TaxID=13397 RepID=UPI001B7EC345|nr:protein CC2D2B-like [Carcharodon carcharias]
MSEEKAKFDFYLSELMTERIPAEYQNRELRREKKKNLFIPSSSPVALTSKLPRNIVPRVLEEEGFYVSHKPDVLKKNINKMENRFLMQEERKYWFGEDGNMIALPDPVELSWKCRLPSLDHVVEDPKPGLETVYRKAIVSEPAKAIDGHFGAISQIYQLDINIANLRFVHHPLFSREHVLAAKLMQLYNNYQERQKKNVSQLLIEKLQTLNNAIKNLERHLEVNSINLSKIEDLKKQMRETKRLLNVEKEKDHTVLTNILKVWKQIKSLRKVKMYICTSVKLQVQELEVNYEAIGKQCEVEYIAEVIELGQELQEKFRKEMETYNEKLKKLQNKEDSKERRPLEDDEPGSEYTDDDPGKPPKLSTPTDREKMEDMARKRSTWIRRQRMKPILIPKLSQTVDVTPISECSGGEMERRMEVQDHKFFISIFYNDKLVSSTVTSQLQSDFNVQFRQIFNIQIIHKPESIRFEDLGSLHTLDTSAGMLSKLNIALIVSAMDALEVSFNYLMIASGGRDIQGHQTAGGQVPAESESDDELLDSALTQMLELQRQTREHQTGLSDAVTRLQLMMEESPRVQPDVIVPTCQRTEVSMRWMCCIDLIRIATKVVRGPSMEGSGERGSYEPVVIIHLELGGYKHAKCMPALTGPCYGLFLWSLSFLALIELNPLDTLIIREDLQLLHCTLNVSLLATLMAFKVSATKFRWMVTGLSTMDLFAGLADGQKFSKIDLYQAYLQMHVDEKSQKYLTITILEGLYRYCCLPFGITSPPALFQRALDQILSGLPGVQCYLDDILVMDKTDEDHLKNLDAALQRLEKYGLWIYELTNKNINMLAKLYIPIPEYVSAICYLLHNMTIQRALELHEEEDLIEQSIILLFMASSLTITDSLLWWHQLNIKRCLIQSCEIVKVDNSTTHTPFFVDETNSEEYLLLTSGKLLYTVSWGVGKDGNALAPPAPKPKTYKESMDAFASIGMSWLNDLQKLAEWARQARVDPNDPQNSDLMQLIKYATEEGQYAPECFRVDQIQEELNFVTDKKWELSKRFRLLMLRNSGAPEYSCFKQVPPYEKEISNNIFQANVFQQGDIACCEKTKTMMTGQQQVPHITIEDINHFPYLGSNISRKDDVESDVHELESQRDDVFMIMGEDSLTEQRMVALKYLEKEAKLVQQNSYLLASCYLHFLVYLQMATGGSVKEFPFHEVDDEDVDAVAGAAHEESSSDSEDKHTQGNAEGVKASVMKRILRVKHPYTVLDMVVECEEISTISQISLALINMITPRKALRPMRKERKKVPAQTLSDGDIKLLINIIGAYNIPMRKCLTRPPLGSPLLHYYAISQVVALRDLGGFCLRIQVQPFVEVTFQQSMYQTSIADGTQPCWNEKLEVEFKSPNGDYNSSTLCKMKDKILINVFDDISVPNPESSINALQQLTKVNKQIIPFQKFLSIECNYVTFSLNTAKAGEKKEKNAIEAPGLPKSHCFETCNLKPHVKHWLGSIAIPFNTVLEQTKVNGTFRLDTPPMLLGYAWKKIEADSCEQFYEFGLAESSLLTIFITLEPQISCSDIEDKQLPLWQLETIEDEAILHMAHTFQREFHNLYPKRRIVVSMIDTECRVGIVTRYIRPLCPPQELLDAFSENPEATFNLIARFVSLIPYLPDNLGFSDSCNIWLTSQQFLNLILGGKEDHAILLCNYFLYMQVNAFVLFGTSILDGAAAYVITQEKMNTMIWNPKTGECYDQYDAFCSVQSADCLINNENIWVNIQMNSLPMSLSFDVTKEYNWRPFFIKSSQHHVLSSVQPQELIYYSTDGSMVDKLQNRIEWALKNKIMDWRAQRPTRWNRYCTGVFQNFLPLLEQNLGRSVSEEQSTALESSLKEFKVSGFPIQMRYSNLETIFDKVYSTGIHKIEIPNVEFAVAVYIYPYPNNVLSVWIYVASLVFTIKALSSLEVAEINEDVCFRLAALLSYGSLETKQMYQQEKAEEEVQPAPQPQPPDHLR